MNVFSDSRFRSPVGRGRRGGVFLFLALCLAAARAEELPLDRIELPPGFRIEVYAADVPQVRSLALSPEGTLFAGSFKFPPGGKPFFHPAVVASVFKGRKVYAISDEDGDFRAERVRTIASGLRWPNGVAFRDGDLWVAEVHRLVKLENIESRLDRPPEPKVITDDFPDDRYHGWKYIGFGPEGWLYVTQGVPCNICDRGDPFGTILRVHPETGESRVYARGLRNSVGFDFHPRTGELWFTDNGRDGLGDNVPPDELNRAPRAGMHFGFPWYGGREVVNPEFADSIPDDLEHVGPEVELGPHVAALGMQFYTGRMFPPRYRGGVFIAEHGSWDRSEPIGYRVSFVPMRGSRPQGYEVFAAGWLDSETGEKWGRPVDLEVMADGSLLVSDDYAGAVYRIFYGE
ncbi:MAG: PQQ-dependent sugar dehydrogenase [Verrucomicrobiales bacterium]